MRSRIFRGRCRRRSRRRRELAGGQGGQDVGVGAGRRPDVAFPTGGELRGGPHAAFPDRALGFGAVGGLPAAEPPRFLVGHAQGDGEVAFPAGVDMGHTPVGAVGFVGVLVVDRIAVGGGEDLAARPVAAQALAFDGPGVVGGEDQPVVLVGLVDDAVSSLRMKWQTRSRWRVARLVNRWAAIS